VTPFAIEPEALAGMNRLRLIKRHNFHTEELQETQNLRNTVVTQNPA